MSIACYPWQEDLAKQLVSLRSHLPNGLIVCGPRGIGTFDLVHAFAKSLLCESPAADGTPCGCCAGCRLAQSGNHPDIQYVLTETEAVARGLPFEPPSGASNTRKNLYRDILIHQPRAISEFLGLTSQRDTHRVVLVYPADRIREDAASVFLKMLEEPPEDVIFLLVAEDLDGVLPTIRSRCRILRAQPPDKETALEWLRSKNVRNPETALMNAGGMPLSVFESDQKLVLEDGVRKSLLQILQSPALGGAPDVTAAVSKDWSLPAVCRFLQRWGWDMAAASAGIPPRYFPDSGNALQGIAQRANRDKLYSWIKKAQELSAVSGHPLNAKLVLEQILFDYLAIFGL